MTVQRGSYVRRIGLLLSKARTAAIASKALNDYINNKLCFFSEEVFLNNQFLIFLKSYSSRISEPPVRVVQPLFVI